MGGAFTMGLVGGSIFAGISGFRNSPGGWASLTRYKGSLQEIRLRGPTYGGAFAAWGGVFSAIDCSLVAIRKKVIFNRIFRSRAFQIWKFA